MATSGQDGICCVAHGGPGLLDGHLSYVIAIEEAWGDQKGDGEDGMGWDRTGQDRMGWVRMG